MAVYSWGHDIQQNAPTRYNLPSGGQVTIYQRPDGGYDVLRHSAGAIKVITGADRVDSLADLFGETPGIVVTPLMLEVGA